MDLLIIFIWIAVITLFSTFGAWYAKKYNKPDGLMGMYVGFVLISNIIAYKIVEFNFGIITFYATAATLVFSVTFLMVDTVNEKFGRKEAQKMILIAFVSQIAVAFFIYISIILKPAPFWQDQEMFAKLMGTAPRLMIASWISFLISENINAYLFAKIKVLTKGKYLWIRNAFSSLPAMLVDSVIFVTIAFYGTSQPILQLIIGVSVIKWIVGIIDIPFMYLNRYIMYKK